MNFSIDKDLANQTQAILDSVVQVTELIFFEAFELEIDFSNFHLLEDDDHD